MTPLSFDSVVSITPLSFDSAVSLTPLSHGSRSYTKTDFHWLSGVNDTAQFWLIGVNDTSEAWLSGVIDTAESWLSGVIGDWNSNVLGNWLFFFETILGCESEAQGDMFDEKNRSSKISWDCPFKQMISDPGPDPAPQHWSCASLCKPCICLKGRAWLFFFLYFVFLSKVFPSS